MLTIKPKIIPFFTTPLAQSTFPPPLYSGTNFANAAGIEKLKKVEKIVVTRKNDDITPISYTVRNLVATAKYITPKRFDIKA